MIQKKQFSFGGLQIEMWVHPQYGCVATTQGFADIVGVTRRNVNILLVKHGLLEERLAAEDADFAKDLIGKDLSRSKKAQNFSKVLLTVKGMIFLTMLLRTERAMAFKNEVLETIEYIESKGHADLAHLAAELDQIKTIVKDQGETILKLTLQNERLLVVIFEQKDKIEHMEEKLGYRAKADKLRRSADGKRLAAGRYEKKIEEMQ